MNSIQEVVNANLCISCGTCVGIAQNDTARMVLNEAKGIFEPEVLDAGRFDQDAAFQACPGKGVSYNALNETQFGAPLDDLKLGSYRSAIAARSADPERRATIEFERLFNLSPWAGSVFRARHKERRDHNVFRVRRVVVHYRRLQPHGGSDVQLLNNVL